MRRAKRPSLKCQMTGARPLRHVRHLWNETAGRSMRRVELRVAADSDSLFTNPGSDHPRQTNLLRFQVKAVSGEIDGLDVARLATQSFLASPSIREVCHQLNDNRWEAAIGSTNWQTKVELLAGTTQLRACAVDPSGNVSTTNLLRLILRDPQRDCVRKCGCPSVVGAAGL